MDRKQEHAFAEFVAESGAAQPAGPAAHGTTVHLTAAQKTLFGLSHAAAKTARPSGRYVVMSEQSASVDSSGSETGPKTSVIDTVTGGGVEYQDITVKGEQGTPIPPARLTAAKGSSPTVAQLDAMPADPTALRANLLATARQQLEQAEKISEQQLAKTGKPYPKAKLPQSTDDDLVFEAATDLLWEPHLSPQLRSALYKVLANTPGVVVNANATDSSGHPAVEISRPDTAGGTNVETFEDPSTGATLESAWNYGHGEYSEDLYESIEYTDTIPADPYKN
ncbi:MAG TPA: hypothetical protein VGG16_15560 [Streptosporangiaceae bacterium]